MKITILSLALSVVMLSTACKGKNNETGDNATTTTQQAPAPTAPVEVAGDEQLRQGVKDATKDISDVQATVNDGEVTLTGTIKRDRLPTLMQSIQSLQPRKVNNELTVQP